MERMEALLIELIALMKSAPEIMRRLSERSDDYGLPDVLSNKQAAFVCGITDRAMLARAGKHDLGEKVGGGRSRVVYRDRLLRFLRDRGITPNRLRP